jgi:hypothetical protein
LSRRQNILTHPFGSFGRFSDFDLRGLPGFSQLFFKLSSFLGSLLLSLFGGRQSFDNDLPALFQHAQNGFVSKTLQQK